MSGERVIGGRVKSSPVSRPHLCLPALASVAELMAWAVKPAAFQLKMDFVFMEEIGRGDGKKKYRRRLKECDRKGVLAYLPRGIHDHVTFHNGPASLTDGQWHARDLPCQTLILRGLCVDWGGGTARGLGGDSQGQAETAFCSRDCEKEGGGIPSNCLVGAGSHREPWAT